MVGNTRHTILSASKSCRCLHSSRLLTFWADKGIAEICKCLYLGVSYVWFLSYHRLWMFAFLSNQQIIQFFQLLFLLSKSIPASTDNFRHFIRLIFATTIFLWLNFFRIHFMLDFPIMDLFLLVQNRAVCERFFSLSLNWRLSEVMERLLEDSWFWNQLERIHSVEWMFNSWKVLFFGIFFVVWQFFGRKNLF